MKTSDFYYDLPQELIAQTPLDKRDSSRLMTLNRATGAVEHHHFYELPDFLNSGDCLILNDSRVLPARLLGQRLPGGGACASSICTSSTLHPFGYSFLRLSSNSLFGYFIFLPPIPECG